MHNLAILKALADDTRIRIVLILLKKEMSVLDIVHDVKKSQPNVSIALKKLEQAGILASRRDKRNVMYSIKEKTWLEKLLEMIDRE